MSTSNMYDELSVLTPTERRSRFWSFGGWDIGWTVTIGCIAALVCVTIGTAFGTLAFMGFVLFWWFTMTTSKKGRYNDRRFMTPFWWYAEMRLAMKKGVIWEAEPQGEALPVNSRSTYREPEAKVDEGATKRAKARSKKRDVVQPFPLEAVGYIDPKNQKSIGLAYHQGKQTYSMVFTGPGSSISARSQIDQYAALQEVAETLKKAALSAGLGGIGIGIGMNTRPQDPWKAPRKMLESCSMRTLAPTALASAKPKSEYTMDDKMDVALHTLQDEVPFITLQSFEVNMMIVVTMSETGAQRQASSKNDINHRDFRRLPIIRIRDMMLPLIKRAIGQNIDVLDLEGVERYLRMSRDAVTLTDYYDEYQERWLDERVAEELARKTGQPVQLPPTVYDRYLPTKNITVGKDFANIDGTWFSVLEMTAFPRSRITASTGASLYNAGTPWMSMAIVGKGANSRMEYEVTNQAQATGRDALDGIGYANSGARVDRKERERYERQAQIDDAGVTMDYIIRFAALAPSQELLDTEIEDEISRFAGFGPVRLSNRAQQWRKLLTTLTLIDCD